MFLPTISLSHTKHTNEQSEKITPLQGIITCQKAAILHFWKERFRFKKLKIQEKNRNLKLSKRKTFRAIQLKKFSKKKIIKYFLENKFQETLSK